MLRQCESTMERQNISDKRKRNAENARKYRERKKAEASAMEPQNIIDRRKRNAEYAKQYRARKKALITASSTVSSNPDVASHTSTVACPSTSTNHDIITYDLAQPSTSTGIVPRSNETGEQESVSEIDDVPKRTTTYKYSDATIIRIAQTISEIASDSEMREKTLHELLARVYMRDEHELRTRWSLAEDKFDKLFVSNEFGSACSVCDRLWFASDVRPVLQRHINTLRAYFRDDDVERFVACSNCYRHLEMGNMAPMSRWYGFRYPPKPPHLPPLDDISARLISPRLPFMQVRRLQHDTGSKAIVGQIVNVPVDVSEMIRTLPRNLDDDCAINVHIKKKIIHKSSYLQPYNVEWVKV